MIEILRFMFESFGHFIGVCFLIAVAGFWLAAFGFALRGCDSGETEDELKKVRDDLKGLAFEVRLLKERELERKGYQR